MTQRLNGAILSYILIAVKLALALFSTPILVSSLGPDGYGLFSIAGAFAAYLYLLDFGMNDSILRFFVRNRDNPQERDRFLAQMLGLYAIIGVLVLAVGWCLSLMAEFVFANSLSPSEIVLLQEMIMVVTIGAAFLLAFNPVGALVSALERFVFLRSLDIVTSILSTVIIVSLLWQGFGAIMVVGVMTASFILQVLIRLVYASFFLGIRVRFALPDQKELKRVAIYAAPIFVAMLAEQVFWKLDNIIIGSMIGAAPVAIYAIGVMFNKYFMSFATAISRIMTPQIIRQIDEGADTDEIIGLMIRISRIQALLLLLILTGLVVFGQQFIELWLGPYYVASYHVLLAVLIPYALELTGNARNIVLQVKGFYWHRTTIMAIMALINIPLTIFLLNIYGVIGAAISTGISILAGYLLTAMLLQIKIKLDMLKYFIGLTHGILPACIISLTVGLWAAPFLPHGWGGLALGIVLYTGVYGLLMLLIGMNSYERKLTLRVVRSATMFFERKTVK